MRIFLLSIFSLYLLFISILNADIIEEINELRKESIVVNDSNIDKVFDNFLRLGDLRREYYESINWYNISESEKNKVINEYYPLGMIVFHHYSVDDGLEILFFEANSLLGSAFTALDILYKYILCILYF